MVTIVVGNGQRGIFIGTESNLIEREFDCVGVGNRAVIGLIDCYG